MVPSTRGAWSSARRRRSMEASGGPTKPEEFRLVLSPDLRAGWRARSALRQRFSNRLPAHTLTNLIAVVTELVNNAVAHGPGKPITVTLVTGRETIRGEVADQGNPAAAIPEIREGKGPGLEVVDKLTSRWAVYEGSTHVWFELPLDG
jgi:two-component sensor histidine kinase